MPTSSTCLIAEAPSTLTPDSLSLSGRGRDDGAVAVDVSVCIAGWNCRDLLRGCLRSLLDAAQGVALEVVVVDNASTDGAADMVAREFPEVVLVRNTHNLGFARANNQAAGRARGRYLFFLNNDTAVPPGTLQRLLKYAETHPEVGMIGPRLRDGQGRFQVSYRSRPTLATLLHRTLLLRWTGLLRSAYRRFRREEFDPHRARSVEVLMGAALFVRRDRFFAWGRWDEEFPFGGEDMELCARVGRHAPLLYLPQVEVTHYGRASTRGNVGGASSQIAFGFARYLRKTGASPSALLAYKTAVTLDAPLQLAWKSAQCLTRFLCGRRAKAGRSLLAVRALTHFVTVGVFRFWRA